MFKTITKYILQKALGFDNYLYVFAIFTYRRLRSNKDEKEFIYFLSTIPENATVLDIGANIGVMTTALAKRATKGNVISFEPMPENINVLKKIIRHFKLSNVTLLETALGDKPGILTMVMPVMNKLKMQGLSHVKEEGSTDEWNSGDEFTVPVQKLDDIDLLKQQSKIDAIKIDVENYEYFVLKGGEQLLRKHMPVIYCELWDNDKRGVCMNYLKGLGYKAKIYSDGKLIDFTDQHNELNFFFVG